MATRKLSDRELEEQFDLLCEHMEELRDNHNPLLKLCSFGECDEGLDVFTVYLDNVKSMRISKIHKHLEIFNKQHNCNVEVENDMDENGGTEWKLFIPLYVERKHGHVSSGKKGKKRHRHSSDGTDFIKWLLVFGAATFAGHFIQEPNIYDLIIIKLF